MEWLTYAIVSMIFFAGMILLFKKVLTFNVKPASLMLFISIFLVFFYLIHVIITKTPTKVGNSTLILIFAAAFLSYVANILYTKSIAIAPNPGYSAAIVSLQLVLIAVASFFLFKSELTVTKGVGIILAIIAGILLSI